MAAIEARPALAFPRPLASSKKSGSSILETLERLRSSGKNELPKEFTVTDMERSTVTHDQWADVGEIPVIDLSLLGTDRAGVVRQVRAAVEEWGFFQIVNHELPLQVQRDAQAEGLKFFALPLEAKERTGLPERGLKPYSGDGSKESISSLHWAESLLIHTEYAEKLSGQLWPEGNENFMGMFVKLTSATEVIAKQVLELIAEGLGLTPEFFAQHLRDKSLQSLRWNFYPACPQPTSSLGASSHTDPNCITILLQDKVGGLQVEKDGRWIGVRPIEGALVVNIGDTLHAWSNGICKSVLHRVVVNTEVPRLSIADFLSVDAQQLISAPNQLIDDSHPRQYKNMSAGEYIKHWVQCRINDKTVVRNGVSILQKDFKYQN